MVAEKKRTGAAAAIFAPNLQWTPCREFYGEISATMHEMPPFSIVSAITDYIEAETHLLEQPNRQHRALNRQKNQLCQRSPGAHK